MKKKENRKKTKLIHAQTKNIEKSKENENELRDSYASHSSAVWFVFFFFALAVWAPWLDIGSRETHQNSQSPTEKGQMLEEKANKHPAIATKNMKTKKKKKERKNKKKKRKRKHKINETKIK